MDQIPSPSARPFPPYPLLLSLPPPLRCPGLQHHSHLSLLPLKLLQLIHWHPLKQYLLYHISQLHILLHNCILFLTPELSVVLPRCLLVNLTPHKVLCQQVSSSSLILAKVTHDCHQLPSHMYDPLEC